MESCRSGPGPTWATSQSVKSVGPGPDLPCSTERINTGCRVACMVLKTEGKQRVSICLTCMMRTSGLVTRGKNRLMHVTIFSRLRHKCLFYKGTSWGYLRPVAHHQQHEIISVRHRRTLCISSKCCGVTRIYQ